MKTFSIYTLLVVTALAVTAVLVTFDVSAAEVDKLVEECSYCHGKDGASSEPKIPTIGGASEYFLSDTMAVYKDKARPCPETEYPAGPEKGTKTDMCKEVAKLSDDDIDALAKFYASKPFVRAKQDFDAEKAEMGKKIHEHHCEKCHADGGSSKEDDAGILAGQWMPYLEHSFKEFTSGERDMPKKMKPKIKKLDASEIDALINYYGSQQ